MSLRKELGSGIETLETRAAPSTLLGTSMSVELAGLGTGLGSKTDARPAGGIKVESGFVAEPSSVPGKMDGPAKPQAIAHSALDAAFAARAAAPTTLSEGTGASAHARSVGMPTSNTFDFADSQAVDGASETHKGLATFRRVTARYHRVEAAIEDGFVPASEDCVDVDPDAPGTVGIPHVNFERIGDGTINPEEPEVLFYEPQKNGKLRLLGGEFAVPIAAWDAVHEEPPALFGQEFHRNENAGLYGLHMWWQHNPAGDFALEHPEVTCEFDAPAP